MCFNLNILQAGGLRYFEKNLCLFSKENDEIL